MNIDKVIENWVNIASREPKAMEEFKEAYFYVTGNHLTRKRCRKCLQSAYNELRKFQFKNVK